MARKTAFVNEMILKTLNQHQRIVPPTVQKAATLDDEVGEILTEKTRMITTRLNCTARFCKNT